MADDPNNPTPSPTPPDGYDGVVRIKTPDGTVLPLAYKGHPPTADELTDVINQYEARHPSGQSQRQPGQTGVGGIGYRMRPVASPSPSPSATPSFLGVDPFSVP